MSLRPIRSVCALALIATVGLSPVRAQEPAAIKPTEVIKLFDGKSLANFDTWLVDHHSDGSRSACSASSIKSTARRRSESVVRSGADS